MAAARGDANAQYEIAVRYFEGRGVPQDPRAAADWFGRAAEQGLAPAQFRLGGLYEKGLGVTKSLERARQLYVAAGEAGNAKALHNLAVLHAEGIDGKPDYQAAARWFLKAAALGMTDSQYNLAVLYARGIGIEQSLPDAYKWFARAAREGDAEAARKRDDVAGRLDAHERCSDRLWNPAEGHHRLRKDNANFVGLVELGQLAVRTGTLDDQRGRCLRVGDQNACDKNHRQGSGAATHTIHL